VGVGSDMRFLRRKAHFPSFLLKYYSTVRLTSLDFDVILLL
jgi:hypothetical protein